MEVTPLHILLAKLEDEISYQRKIVNTFLFLSNRLPQDLVLRSLDVLRRTAQTLRLISLVMAELEDLTDPYMREQALLMSSECLSLTSLLLPALEHVSPIFIEQIMVYEEPILDRIESLAEFIEVSIQSSEAIPTDEVSKTIEDILKTLEYHIRMGERTLGKIL